MSQFGNAGNTPTGVMRLEVVLNFHDPCRAYRDESDLVE